MVKHGGSPSSFLRYTNFKTKYRVFLEGSFVAMVTCHVTLMSASCQAFVGVSYGVMTFPLSETVGQIQSYQIVVC